MAHDSFIGNGGEIYNVHKKSLYPMLHDIRPVELPVLLNSKVIVIINSKME